MSTSVTVRAHTDTWLEHDSPRANHGAGAKIRLRSDDTDHGRHGLIFFDRPFPLGATITSAILRLYVKGGWSGVHTITARRITDPWKENRVTWANQPSASDTNLATVVVTDVDDGDEVTLDLTDLFADVSSGDTYDGLKLSLSEDEARALYSSDSPKPGITPKLDVEWSSAPYPPSNLQPAGGRAVSIASPILAWRFSDKRGSTKQGWSQVQVSDSADFSAPLYDSGKVANVRHSWNLAGELVIPTDVTRWWRVRVWDEAGLVSGWSNAVQFERVAQGNLTIVNPAPAPDNIVDETSPPITWSSDVALERIRLVLDRVKDNGGLQELYEFKEQVVEAGFDSITLPENLLKSETTFRVRLFGWDTVDRQGTPGDPPFIFAQRDFTYERAGTPAPVETLQAAAFGPVVRLTWTRTTEPDYFCLVVNGEEVLQRIDPDDVLVDVGTYQLDYWRAISGEETTYEVEAVVVDTGRKKHSAGNQIRTATTEVKGKYLVDEDDGLVVHIKGGEQANLEIAESGTTYRLPGNRRPVRITDSIGGHEGPISGVLDPGQEADFLELKGRDTVLRYIQSKTNVPVRLAESAAPPDSSRLGNYYLASTTILQVDEFFDVEGL